ncbi:protein kinase [Streptomyces caelestis]|uniref:Protein kinase n=1 Tax=Streptomyces heliomycini TaxID=284032 RepID=A0ABV5L606_9ACTN|nr:MULTISPECIES: protein kinase [Streptomyces]
MSTALGPDDPERLGGYWLAARLGSGGQGVVYEAYDAQGARVALKALHRGAEPFVRQRFGREATAARQVPPFCTARILDVHVPGTPVGQGSDTTAGSAGEAVPFIVSEYVAGPTLAAQVRDNGPLDPDAGLRLATGAATALAAIHSAGVVHRDLKPGNILLGPDGPRIIDFGIALAPDMSVTAPGALMGTFGYMAPEVLSGQRATPASDVFAWGAVVLYAMSADEPFRGAHIGEVAHRTASLDPDLSKVPVRFRPLIASALAKEPQHRPTAQELLLGLIGELPKAADPRRALLREGARQAVATDTLTDTGTAVLPLGDRAEAAFSALGSAAQLAAREVLLRTVVPGDASDGSQDSVRTVDRPELYERRPESEQRSVREAADVLTAEGILETDEEESVRPVSAALIPAWRRLREWVDDERAGLSVHRRLGEAARGWQAHGEHPDDLLRGTTLRTCLDWLATAPFHLRPNPLEARFIVTARTAAARSVRRRRQLLAGLAMLTVFALLAGLFGWFQARESRNQRAAAELRRAQAAARSVAQSAESLRGSRPDTALLLSLASWRVAHTPESRAALTAAASQQQTAVIDLPQPAHGIEATQVLLGGGRSQVTVTPTGSSIWDLSKGREGARNPVATFDGSVGIGPAEPPKVVASRDGRLLVVPTKSGKRTAYRIVSTRDGRPLGKPVADPGGSFLPDQLTDKGDVLFSSPSGDFRLVGSSGEPIASWSEEGSISVVSPDGRYYATCVPESQEFTEVWAIRPGTPDGVRYAFSVDADPSEAIDCSSDIDFSSDGGRVALKYKGRVTVCPTAVGGEKCSDVDIGDSDVTGLSSSGTYVLAYSYNGRIEVFSSDGGPALFRRAGVAQDDDEGWLTDQVILDERAKALVYRSLQGNQILRFDLTAALSATGRPPTGEGATVSPDGSVGMYRTGYPNPRFQHLVDMRTGAKLGPVIRQRIPEFDVPDVDQRNALSADGRRLAFIDFEGPGLKGLSVVVWDIDRDRELYRVPVPEGRVVLGLSIAPDGRHVAVGHHDPGVASGKGGTIEVWDAQEHRRVHQFANLDGHGVFSPDSRLLVTTRGDILDLTTGRTRRVGFDQERTSDLAFSPDGGQLAVLKGSGWAEVWDGAVRRRLARMPRGTVQDGVNPRGDLYHPTFSADGTLLAASISDSHVQIWDVSAHLALGGPIDPTATQIDAMAFDGDVLRVLSGTRAHALDLNPDRLISTVCRKAGRDITREEWRSYVPDVPYHSVC